MQNDVAMLKLLKPVTLDQNGFTNAVCLPATERPLPVGSVCMAAGWGKISRFHSINFLFVIEFAEFDNVNYHQESVPSETFSHQ